MPKKNEPAGSRAMNYRFSVGEKLEREQAAGELRQLLDRIIGDGGFDLRCRVETNEPQPGAIDPAEIRAAFEGPDQDLLLERNGELLQAIEYLAVRCLRLDPRLYKHIRLDAAGYRDARVEELKLSARIAAQRVLETGQPFRFNPMPARERRVIHLMLAEYPAVRSQSEGQGEKRQVVVHPVKPPRPKH